MATYEQVTYNSPDGAQICSTSSEKVAFYGKAPVARRAYTAAVHASGGVATSASFGPTQAAALAEIQQTLIGLGIWGTV